MAGQCALYIVLCPRTIFVGPQLQDIISTLKEITEPHILGIHLGIERYKLEQIEKKFPRDVDRQMAEVVAFWLRNNTDCSWGALASAVEKMGGYGNLVKRLRDRHIKALTTATTREA